jgi:hypothetical protein
LQALMLRLEVEPRTRAGQKNDRETDAAHGKASKTTGANNSHCLEVSPLYAIRQSNEHFAVGATYFLNTRRVFKDKRMPATRTLECGSHANASRSVGGSDDQPDNQNKHNDSAHDGRQHNPRNGFLSVLVTRDAKHSTTGEREAMFRANYRLATHATLSAGWA